jgi:signal transduction histidine kinase
MMWEDLQRENEKLRRINAVLMDRVERSTDWQGNGFSLFQAAIVLEGRVEERTGQLQSTLRQLETVNHDLTRATELAETARRRLREAIESISEGFALFDADDRLVLWNNNYVGFIAGLGQSVTAGTHFTKIIRKAVENGAIRDAIGREEDWIAARLAYHRHPDRAFVYRFTDNRWVQVNERRTHEGGTVAVYTDITDIKMREQQRRERELAEKSVLLQATLESLSQGVAVFDRDLRLVAWNQHYFDMHRFPLELAAEGTPYAEFLRCNAKRGEYGPGDVEDLVAARLGSARAQVPRSFERMLANGKVVEVAANPMPDGGFVITYSDITQRKRADDLLRESEKRLKAAAQDLLLANEGLERRVEQRTAELRTANQELQQAKVAAEQANLSKTKFLAAASHDLHQPLNAARLFVAALAEGDFGKPDRDLLDGIDNALEATDGLLRALFDISKLDAGAMTAELADMPIGPLLDQLGKEYRPQAADSGLGLTVLPCGLAVRTDPRLLARILRNFLSNAIRYTERGRVVLGCKRRGDSLVIGVWDTGSGVPEEKMAEIFQEFQQIAQPGRRREKGMGLGLAIVERIARLLKHPLDVTSQVGKGSCFAVVVPMAAAATGSVPAEARPLMPPARNNFAGLKVVAVDDDPSGLEAISALLAAWHCQVVSLRSGLEVATWLASAEPPDAIIADYHLGDDTNGLAQIQEIRRHFGNDLPAMLVTSDRDPAIRASAKELGLPMLNKPVQPAKLRALLSHLISQ